MNTFQTILVTNGRESYVFFHYGDIAWTTGEASGGDEHGLEGTAAAVTAIIPKLSVNRD